MGGLSREYITDGRVSSCNKRKRQRRRINRSRVSKVKMNLLDRNNAQIKILNQRSYLAAVSLIVSCEMLQR